MNNSTLGALESGSPMADALQDSSISLSYGELSTEVEMLARYFAELGIKAGDRVAISATKSVGTVVAILAVLRASGCYVPISPDTPKPRQEMLIKDTAPTIFVTPKITHGNPAKSFDYDVVRLSDGQALNYLRSDLCGNRFLIDGEGGRSPAYVLYTSGSTGRPKGVVISRDGAMAFAEWAAKLVSLGPGDKVLNVTRFDFDLSTFDIFSTLLAGATLFVGEESLVRSPETLLETIRTRGITTLYTVPWVLVQMLKCEAQLLADCRFLRTIMYAGEVFPIIELKNLKAKLPHVAFHNLFGPTETNVCAAYSLPDAIADETKEIPIGTPASGSSVYLLSGSGQPVPNGEIGEIFVEGPAVMTGYMVDGMLTKVGPRYATGDLAVRRADGAMMFRGRRDTMKKVHGMRVEPLEIERVIGNHPRVHECAAVIADQRLVAFVRVSDAPVSGLAIRQHVASFLPPYMVPTSVYFVREIPRNSNAKIDRQQLIEMCIAGSRPAAIEKMGKGALDGN